MASNRDDEWVPAAAPAPTATNASSKAAAAEAALETLKAGFTFASSAPRQGAYDEDVYDDGGEEFWDEYIDPDELRAGKGVFSRCGFPGPFFQFPRAQISASSLEVPPLQAVAQPPLHLPPKSHTFSLRSATWTNSGRPST